MASPQVENGHIAIATELIEALAGIRISGVEWQCLLVIIRKTYGWKKKMDWIALSQFQEMTGVSKPHIIRALGNLIDKNIVVRKGNGVGVSYGIIKNYHKWKSLPKKVTFAKNGKKPSQKRKSSLPKMEPTIETTTIETITKEIPDWIPKEEWNAYAEMRIEKKFPLTSGAITVAINKLKKLKEAGSRPEDVLENSVLCGYRGLFPSKSNGKDKSYTPTGRQPCKICGTTALVSYIGDKCAPCWNKGTTVQP